MSVCAGVVEFNDDQVHGDEFALLVVHLLFWLVLTDSRYHDVLLCVTCSHSATLFNNRLVVFGGWDAPVCYSDLFILDLSEFGVSSCLMT